MTSSSPRVWQIGLGLAAAMDIGLAGYHFFIPFLWRWDAGLHTTQPMLVWTIYALNFSWSLLVLILGLLVGLAALRESDRTPFTYVAVFALGLFWLIHGAYEWRFPLPMPPRLALLKTGLAVFPAIAVAAHWAPIWQYRPWRESRAG